MKTTLELTAEQEAQAQELATRLTEAIAADVLRSRNGGGERGEVGALGRGGGERGSRRGTGACTG
jgi:hypothetical protein